MSNTNPLIEAHEAGQSLWFDFIQRSMMTNGDLERLINDDHVQGITSNPSIFEAAIANTDEYDAQISSILNEKPGTSAMEIFKQLAITDISNAADGFLGTYKASRGDDGMVSLEVSPGLAHDTEGTIAEAVELHAALNRDNVMIKVPGTSAGVKAFEELTARGISVNVTLLFSVGRYKEIVQAYLRGLERRVEQSLPVDKIASVASFFVSRVDAAVDSALADSSSDNAAALKGKIAIANAKVAYSYYQSIFNSEQFAKLSEAGALAQRLLWASTGTKDPEYSDVYYVEELMGPNTVNTVPPKTLDAFRDHGTVENRLEQGLPDAQKLLDQLAALDINLEAITQKLEAAGVASFSEAFDRLLAAIDQKCSKIKAA
ncbi:transaldolase [Chromatiales bacterium (ex Bugula neritina AB1)]|nr:transaldolase [Chromatiales bacterium (ex Bugula neritina AB1)]